ncbi:hypothetical protein VPH35_018349 [Triticum aestivum]
MALPSSVRSCVLGWTAATSTSSATSPPRPCIYGDLLCRTPAVAGLHCNPCIIYKPLQHCGCDCYAGYDAPHGPSNAASMEEALDPCGHIP